MLRYAMLRYAVEGYEAMCYSPNTPYNHKSINVTNQITAV
jgi:hypothetical protein